MKECIISDIKQGIQTEHLSLFSLEPFAGQITAYLI